MYVFDVKFACDSPNCTVVIEEEQRDSYLHARDPKGWFKHGNLIICPECQKKMTIAELRALNKKTMEEEDKRDEEEDY